MSDRILDDKFVQLNVAGAILILAAATMIAFVAISYLAGDTGQTLEKTATTTCSSAEIPSGAMANINTNMNVYTSAADQTNIPWEMLAAVHFREANNRPDGSLISGRKIGTPEPDQGGRVYSSLQETAVHAGQVLQGKVGNKLTKDVTDAALIKNAFWRYNGTAYGSADNSPYVMNNFDEAHKNMPIITKDGGKIDGKDTRNGAYTTYSILKGSCS